MVVESTLSLLAIAETFVAIDALKPRAPVTATVTVSCLHPGTDAALTGENSTPAETNPVPTIAVATSHPANLVFSFAGPPNTTDNVYYKM